MKVFRSEWFWLVVILAAFVAALLLWEPDPCRDGFYWEEGFGCIRE